MYTFFLKFSQIVGGLYAYLSLSNIDEISRTLRIRLYGGLLGCAIFGILLLFTLRKPHKTDNISHQQLINMEMNSSGDNLSELTPDYSTWVDFFYIPQLISNIEKSRVQ